MNLKVLKNKNYTLVLLGRFVSEFGTYMQSFALSLYVLEKTGSAAMFSLVMVVSIIPRIILMPFAGVLADRFSRKKMVVAMDILSGLSVLFIVGIYLINYDLSLVWIYIIVVILNVISVFFSPAMGSMIPDIVEKDKLADANSLMGIGEGINAVLVPIVAGILYSTFGIAVIMAVNGISFLISALSESFIKLEKESLEAEEDRESFFKSFKSGLTYLKGMPEFVLMIAITVIANFAVGPLFSIALPVVVLQDFGLPETTYGIIAALMPIGLFLGPLLASKIIKKFHYSKIISVLLIADGILCLLIAICAIKGIFPNIYYNIAGLIVLVNIILITIIWINLSATTARQIIVPGNMQGRVFAVAGMFSMIASPFGQALMGILLDVKDTFIIIVIYSLVILLSGIVAKVGFAALVKNGKMDITIGVEQPAKLDEEKVYETA